MSFSLKQRRILIVAILSVFAAFVGLDIFSLFLDFNFLILPLCVVMAIILSIYSIKSKDGKFLRVLQFIYTSLYFSFTDICLSDIKAYYYLDNILFYGRILAVILSTILLFFCVVRRKLFPELPLLTLIGVFVFVYFCKLQGYL